MADDEGAGLRERLSRQSEEALGKLASDLLENPLINSAIARAFTAREKAVQAQEMAMGALNLPSAADIDRLTRRLRTVSNRLEGIEEAIDRLQEGVDRLTERLGSVSRGTEPALADRLDNVEGQLAKLLNELGTVSLAIDARPAPVPREQERLAVDEPDPKPARKRAAKKPSS
jgi:chromosome segregation ATPase